MSHLDKCSETIENCSDTEAHYQAADALKIPGCLPNRRAQVETLWGMGDADEQSQVVRSALCVSEHCPRCQNLRVFRGEEPLDNNAFLKMPPEPELWEDREAIADVLALDLHIVTMVYRNIPAPGPDDARAWGDRFSLAQQLAPLRENWLALHPNATPAMVQQALAIAAEWRWETDLVAKHGFPGMAHTVLHILIAGEIISDESEECEADGEHSEK